jgi:hypothetical protein
LVASLDWLGDWLVNGWLLGEESEGLLLAVITPHPVLLAIATMARDNREYFKGRFMGSNLSLG